jgi:hypothetical protein
MRAAVVVRDIDRDRDLFPAADLRPPAAGPDDAGTLADAPVADETVADAPVADVAAADVADVAAADLLAADLLAAGVPVAATGLPAAARPDAPAPPNSVVPVAVVGEPASSALPTTGSAMGVAAIGAAASAAAAAGSPTAGDWSATAGDWSATAGDCRASHPVGSGAEPQGVRTLVVSRAATWPAPALPPADFGAAGVTPGRCSIVDTPERGGGGAGVVGWAGGAGGADEPTAISSATRSSAARMIEGSGVSAAGLIEPMRAPAEAAVEDPAGRAVCSGRVGALVSDRHRSSHSSLVPPHPRT